MRVKKVKPCGMLYSHQREYFLLNPFPLQRDWELDTERRFVVVPRKAINLPSEFPIYSHARHIVTNAYTIEYADIPEIEIKEIELDLYREDINYDREEVFYGGS